MEIQEKLFEVNKTPPPVREGRMPEDKPVTETYRVWPSDLHRAEEEELPRHETRVINYHEQFPELFREDGHLYPSVSRQFFSEDTKTQSDYRSSLTGEEFAAVMRHTLLATVKNRCKECTQPDRPDVP